MTGNFEEGQVAWTGENHLMQFEAGAEGPWTALFAVFRIRFSPFGPGEGVFALAAPDAVEAERRNICITNNEALFRWLRATSVGHYGAFRGRKALERIRFEGIHRHAVSWLAPDAYAESYACDDTEVALEWRELQTPFLVDLKAAETAAKTHDICGTYMTARIAEARMDGTSVGRPLHEKSFVGRKTTSAYCMFADTWSLPRSARCRDSARLTLTR